MNMSQVLVSMKALIKRGNKFLITKERMPEGDVWDLPGGKPDYGESPEETLKREVFEEIRAEIKILQSVGVWYFFQKRGNDQVICHTFLCELVDSDCQFDTSQNPADEDIYDWLWLTIPEILSREKVILPESLEKLLSRIA